MRQKFFDTVGKFEPFAELHVAGVTSAGVKEAIVCLLDPYLRDKELLQRLATSVLAAEAVCVGRLSAKAAWKEMLDQCYRIREAAFRVDPSEAAKLAGHFEPSIREAQRTFALLVVFEVTKSDLALDEFAFELLSSLGILIESNIQAYLKELYCMQALASGLPVDAASVACEDLGRICEKLEPSLTGTALLTPEPWQLRVNQWRNIAQHQSFTTSGDFVVLTYGKAQPRKQLSITRDELLSVARELMQRVAALKCSRALSMINHVDTLENHIPDTEPDQYAQATSLAASLGTQGFRLLSIQVSEHRLIADIEDVAPRTGYERPIHCSQFVALIADRFPGLAIQIRYIFSGLQSWTFDATAHDLERVMALDDPLTELAHIVVFKRQQRATDVQKTVS